MKGPSRPGFWWARSTETRRWQMFFAAYKAHTKTLVVTLADVFNPETERGSAAVWFTPNPSDWELWQQALPPKEFPDADLPASSQGLSRLATAIFTFWNPRRAVTIPLDLTERENVARDLAAHILKNVPTMTFPEPGTLGRKAGVKAFGIKFNEAMRLSEKRKAQRLAKARKK